MNRSKEVLPFNLELDPQNGNYIVISEGNYRLSISVAAYAVKNNAWVLIEDELIKDFGSMDSPYKTKGEPIKTLDATGRFVFPSW